MITRVGNTDGDFSTPHGNILNNLLIQILALISKANFSCITLQVTENRETTLTGLSFTPMSSIGTGLFPGLPTRSA